ncbi:MAG: chloride channel protein [Clostridia bacterium]|nr:chloride channel protein [Clostridia bacterium]
MKNKNKGASIVAGILKWTGLALIMGAVCGIVGAAFSHAISFVTGLRTAHHWILYLLPVGGILSVFIYKLFDVTHLGTDDAVESAHSEKKVSPALFPAVFICSVITHLFGGSAGREGAALKMGGGIAAFFSRAFKLSERGRRTLALCAMSAVFSAVFGAPFGAAFFTVEVVRSAYIRPYALILNVISSLSAFGMALLLFVKPERYHVSDMPSFEWSTLLRVAALGAVCGIISLAFCHAMHYSPKLSKKYIKNPYVRIVSMSLLLIALTFISGTRDYNGGGVAFIESIFEGHQVVPWAFALKLLFTAVTVAAGFKGGEIVPGFFVGATAGAVIAPLLGLPAAAGAALGMAALFAGITNCPISTFILSMEMFGAHGIPYFIVTIVVSFLLSGRLSLYDKDKYPIKRLISEYREMK